MPRVTLIGYRGTGKSTVAALLGGMLGCDWDDADQELERTVGCSITALIRSRGEAAFRDEESAVLVRLLEHCRGVLSTGGGVVLRAGNRRLLRQSGRPVVWLTASAEVLHERIMADPTTPERRPSLAGGSGECDSFTEVLGALRQRESLYRECADMTIDTASMPASEVASRIVAWLNGQWPAAGSPPGERP